VLKKLFRNFTVKKKHKLKRSTKLFGYIRAGFIVIKESLFNLIILLKKFNKSIKQTEQKLRVKKSLIQTQTVLCILSFNFN